MRIEILADPWAVAKQGAAIIAEESKTAISARGQFLLALSGGKSPWKTIQALAKEPVAWDHVHIFQVDERVAPEGHPDRNLTTLREILLAQTPLREDQIHPMPVDVDDLEAGAADYTHTLQQWAGTPPVLDLINLGLGSDGHTASLIPGDPALGVDDLDVTITDLHFGRHRMTLTTPILNRARHLLWIVTGAEKSKMVKRLTNADPAISAGRIRQDNATLLLDPAAGALLPESSDKLYFPV